MDIQSLNNKKKSIPKKENIKEMMKDPTLVVYPNLRLLLQIVLTLPVISNKAECSFSWMRRVLTWLRTSTDTDRLSSLSRMVAHPDRVQLISIQNITNKFNEKTPRKLEFNVIGRILFICLNLGTAVEKVKKMELTLISGYNQGFRNYQTFNYVFL